jgi:hypothetical protein
VETVGCGRKGLLRQEQGAWQMRFGQVPRKRARMKMDGIWLDLQATLCGGGGMGGRKEKSEAVRK